MGVEDAGRVRGQPRVGRLERFDGATSADHLPDDLAMNVGQAKVSACVAVDQPGVVESHQDEKQRRETGTQLETRNGDAASIDGVLPVLDEKQGRETGTQLNSSPPRGK